MIENEIHEEIRRIRSEHPAECGYDATVMFARMDAELERLKAEAGRSSLLRPAKRKPPTLCAKNRRNRIREKPMNLTPILAQSCGPDKTLTISRNSDMIRS